MDGGPEANYLLYGNREKVLSAYISTYITYLPLSSLKAKVPTGREVIDR